MSFICQECNKQQPTRLKPYNQVVEKRFVKYPEIKKHGKKIRPEGYEIAKELKVCNNCYDPKREVKISDLKVVKGNATSEEAEKLNYN